MTHPAQPADYLDMFRPLRPGADLRARVVEVRPETADAVTVVLRPGGAWRGHVPGQYVRVGLDVDGVRLWRSYSLTSAPDAPDGLLVDHRQGRPRRRRQHPPGPASCGPGSWSTSTRPWATSCSRTRRPDKVLFVTGGSGITPVMGMLRSGLDRLGDVVLVHSEPTADDVIFGDELRALAADGRLRLVEQHTDAAGRLDVDGARRAGPRPRRAGDLGLRAGRPARRDRGALGRARRSPTGCTPSGSGPQLAEPGEGGTVTLHREPAPSSRPTAPPRSSTPASRPGVLMPSGCRMGICFGCVLPLREGAVRDLRSGDLTTAAPGDGVLVQTCVSAAAGACDIDL